MHTRQLPRASRDFEARSVQDFLHAMVDLNPKIVFALVQKIANSLTLPPMDVDQVLIALSSQGLIETVTALPF